MEIDLSPIPDIRKNQQILDKDKLILIYYVDFKLSTPTETIAVTLCDIKNNLERSFDNSVRIIMVPTFRGDGDNRIDCINLSKCTEEQIERFEKY